MSDYLVTDTELTGVADAIRTKGGTSSALEWPDGYVDAIDAISGGDSTFVVTVSYDSSTQKWEPDCTYAEVLAAANANKAITVQSDSPVPTSADGYWVGDPDYMLRYIVSELSQDGLTVTNYEYEFSSIGLYEFRDEYIYPNFQAKTNVTPTTSSQTITPDSGYNGLSSVQIDAMPSGTAGTPTATKGTVSNHSVSVTPSVTNTTGYITGGTKTGTAVSVSASELVSGSETKTANGTYDVTNLAELVVNVASEGDFETEFANTIMRYNASITKIPSSITKIGTYAFYNCTRLTLTSLPSGITAIETYGFYMCTNLALTSLPSGITVIANYAFYQCAHLTLTSLPSALKTIGMFAFSRCVGITSISSEAAITSVGNNAFNGTSTYSMSLTSARFPNMALSSALGPVFGSSTAANACHLLEICDIGKTTSIAANSFANCYKLQTLILRKTASICTLANVSAFTNTPMNGYNGLTGTVYVPSALISTYQTATNWSTLYNNGTVTFAAIEGSQYEL